VAVNTGLALPRSLWSHVAYWMVPLPMILNDLEDQFCSLKYL